MRSIKGIFPGVFTMGNMFFGFLSILASFNGEVVQAAWFIILAGFLDALDGQIARFSKSSSRFGIELDSLSDFISFGAAPAVLFYSLKLHGLGKWGWVLGFVYIMCGAFRLARFNVEGKTQEREYYTGLPIPSSSITLVSYTLFCHEIWGELRFHEILITMIIVFSALMVSEIAYETLPKFSLNSRKNKIKLVYFFMGIIAVLIKPRLVIFPLGLIYVISGIAAGFYSLFHLERKEEIA